jgi:hypothetical protein
MLVTVLVHECCERTSHLLAFAPVLVPRRERTPYVWVTSLAVVFIGEVH